MLFCLTPDNITAFSTFLLFIVTFFLGCIAYRQENTSRRQLRAYVFVEKSQVEFIQLSGSYNMVTNVSDFDRAVRTTLEIKNSGQTPAQDSQTFGQIDFQEWPLDESKLKLIDFSNKGISKETLGPGNIRYKNDVININQTQWEQLNNGTHAIFVYGVIKYKDVFGETQTTHYRFFTGGEVKLSRGNGLLPHDEGNKAS
jgi:cbb3-type cytochrome oxidase subunit 3